MNDKKLNPCPFCGSEDVHEGNFFDSGTYCTVQCSNCLSMGPIIYETQEMIDLRIKNKNKKDHCLIRCIERWNKRA